MESTQKTLRLRNVILLLIATVLLSSGVSYGYFNYSENGKKIVSDKIYNQTTPRISYSRPQTTLTNLPINQSTTCSFERVVTTSFENPEDPFAEDKDREIYYSNDKQSNPIITSFVDLDTDYPKMTANNGQSALVKVIDNADIVTLVDDTVINTGDNLIIYTIHKKYGVASWTKQYSLLSTPLALVSMGYCN